MSFGWVYLDDNEIALELPLLALKPAGRFVKKSKNHRVRGLLLEPMGEPFESIVVVRHVHTACGYTIEWPKLWRPSAVGWVLGAAVCERCRRPKG